MRWIFFFFPYSGLGSCVLVLFIDFTCSLSRISNKSYLDLAAFLDWCLQIYFFFFFWRDWFFISKRHLSIFSIKTVTLLFFFFLPVGPQRRPHQRREHFKPIKLQDAHLTDLTETSSKKGDWVGKETLKDQHTAGPQTVESSHRQRGDQCASTPKKQRSKI